jgi:hypothetical protein
MAIEVNFALFIAVVSLPCLKGLSLPMSRIKVRLPSAPRVEMIM